MKKQKKTETKTRRTAATFPKRLEKTCKTKNYVQYLDKSCFKRKGL